MSESKAYIQIECSKELRAVVKKAILEKGFDNFHDGYKEIFSIGLKQFKKLSKEDISQWQIVKCQLKKIFLL